MEHDERREPLPPEDRVASNQLESARTKAARNLLDGRREDRDPFDAERVPAEVRTARVLDLEHQGVSADPREFKERSLQLVMGDVVQDVQTHGRVDAPCGAGEGRKFAGRKSDSRATRRA